MIKLFWEISRSECSPLVTRVLKSPSGKESSFRIMCDSALPLRIRLNDQNHVEISAWSLFFFYKKQRKFYHPETLDEFFMRCKELGNMRSQNEIPSLGPISNKSFSKSPKAHTAEIFEWFIPNLRIPVTILLWSLRSHRIRYYPQAYPRFPGNFRWCVGKY